MPELGTVNRREIAALVGVAPFQRQSGKYVGQAKIAGGRPDVRRVLYMATMSAIRHNKPIADFYSKLIADGKKGKLALVAAMRKFITILNAIAASIIVPNP
ncbi:transposase [Niveispirillum sp. KHB5.9]|uniref:transposase n=1 Tax=Niveispirillum sp. KHB5.9 TaxID=3400269 RepID=UPI003A85C675